MSLPLLHPRWAITPTLHATVFVDASGGADRDRHWGVVVAIGTSQRDSLAKGIHRLKITYPQGLDPITCEPKLIPASGVVLALRWLKERDVLYFPYPVSAFDDPRLSDLPGHLVSMLSRLRPHPVQRDQRRLAGIQNRVLRYVRDTNDNPKNRHKLVSLLALSNRTADLLGAKGIPPRLKSATIFVDNEDFRIPGECAWVMKWFFASALQGAGMIPAVSGNAPYEPPCRGNIRARVNCPSHRFAGIQFADIVARAARKGILDILL